MISKYKLHYGGSLFWLIFWAIFFFPMAVLFLYLNAQFESPETRYFFEYNGSVFWLGFWLIVFFPLAIVLLLLNGVTLCRQLQQPGIN